MISQDVLITKTTTRNYLVLCTGILEEYYTGAKRVKFVWT